MDCRLCYFCRSPFKPSRVDQFLCTSPGNTDCYDRLLRLNQAADNYKIQYGGKVGTCCYSCGRDDLPMLLVVKPGASDLLDHVPQPWDVIALPLDRCVALCKDCRIGYQLWYAHHDASEDFNAPLISVLVSSK